MHNFAPKVTHCSYCVFFFLFSVLLGLLFSVSLSSLRHDFKQRQQNRHTHGQKEWYVDSKLLVIRKVQEVEK